MDRLLIREQHRPVRLRMDDPYDIDEIILRKVDDQMPPVGMNPYRWFEFLPSSRHLRDFGQKLQCHRTSL